MIRRMNIHGKSILFPRILHRSVRLPSILLASILLALFTLPSCHSPKPAPLFELMENTGIQFSNDVRNKPDFNILTYRNFYNGGGVAIGDINNDGMPDIFFHLQYGRQ